MQREGKRRGRTDTGSRTNRGACLLQELQSSIAGYVHKIDTRFKKNQGGIPLLDHFLTLRIKFGGFRVI